MNRYVPRSLGKIVTPEGESLPVRRGWSPSLARCLVEQSLQPDIVSRTRRDSEERFASQDAAEEWYGNPYKQPIVYSLGMRFNYLAGVAWFSTQINPAVPDAEMTFAIRMYDGYSGRGLAAPFAQIAHKEMDFLYDLGTWLETDADNEAALKLYDRLGYETRATTDEGRILMARPAPGLV